MMINIFGLKHKQTVCVYNGVDQVEYSFLVPPARCFSRCWLGAIRSKKLDKIDTDIHV